jgi:hypothetical protein
MQKCDPFCTSYSGAIIVRRYRFRNDRQLASIEVSKLSPLSSSMLFRRHDMPKEKDDDEETEGSTEPWPPSYLPKEVADEIDRSFEGYIESLRQFLIALIDASLPSSRAETTGK